MEYVDMFGPIACMMEEKIRNLDGQINRCSELAEQANKRKTDLRSSRSQLIVQRGRLLAALDKVRSG